MTPSRNFQNWLGFFGSPVHWSHSHINIQLGRLLNYLREGTDEDFGLNRFDGGTPGGRPGGSIDVRRRFFWQLIVWHYAQHQFLLGAFGVLGLIWCASNLRLCSLWVLSLPASFLGFWDHDLFIIRIVFIRILIAKAFALRRLFFLPTFKCQGFFHVKGPLLHEKNIFQERECKVNRKIQYKYPYMDRNIKAFKSIRIEQI